MTGVASLDRFLLKHNHIGLDTSIFIYELEDYPRYQPLARRTFQWLAEPPHSGVTSTLTMTEVLTRPYAQQSPLLVNAYYKLLSLYPNLDWIAPDLEIADLAARFRAEHKMRTPDAIQAATAVRSGAKGFISNDPVFRRVPGLDVLLFEELAT